jgi:hypothetical protein
LQRDVLAALVLVAHFEPIRLGPSRPIGFFVALEQPRFDVGGVQTSSNGQLRPARWARFRSGTERRRMDQFAALARWPPFV